MDTNYITNLVKDHSWVPLAALIIGALIRISKDDKAVAWFPVSIPPRWRPWAAMILGAAAGCLDSVMSGTPWSQAALSGVTASALAMAGHDVIVEGARGGRDIFEKKAPPPAENDGPGVN